MQKMKDIYLEVEVDVEVTVATHTAATRLTLHQNAPYSSEFKTPNFNKNRKLKLKKCNCSVGSEWVAMCLCGG